MPLPPPDGCAFGINSDGVVVAASTYGPRPLDSEAQAKRFCNGRGRSVVVFASENVAEIERHFDSMKSEKPLI